VSFLLVSPSIIIIAVMTAFPFVEFLIDSNEFFAPAAHVQLPSRSIRSVGVSATV
jgi:hypothetical protein